MFINVGARKMLLQAERDRFLKEQWPAINATIERLGLTPQDLITANTAKER
jgi:GntR family transcriptional regulator